LSFVYQIDQTTNIKWNLSHIDTLLQTLETLSVPFIMEIIDLRLQTTQPRTVGDFTHCVQA